MYSARPPNCIATFRLVINLMHSCGFVNYPTEHFTAPESLSDPVDCPSCRRKTPTKKQQATMPVDRALTYEPNQSSVNRTDAIAATK
jgi:hypothetical protein